MKRWARYRRLLLQPDRNVLLPYVPLPCQQGVQGEASRVETRNLTIEGDVRSNKSKRRRRRRRRRRKSRGCKLKIVRLWVLTFPISASDRSNTSRRTATKSRLRVTVTRSEVSSVSSWAVLILLFSPLPSHRTSTKSIRSCPNFLNGCQRLRRTS